MTPEEQMLLNEGRLLRATLPVLLPILKERRELATDNMIARFRAGESNLLTAVAEITVLRELEEEMISKEQEITHLEEKYHGN